MVEINMSDHRYQIYFVKIVRTLIIIALLTGFGLILEHATHHHIEYDSCEICLFASALLVAGLLTFFFFQKKIFQFYVVLQRYKATHTFDDKTSRGPPIAFFS
jgi:O-antigen ligase